MDWVCFWIVYKPRQPWNSFHLLTEGVAFNTICCCLSNKWSSPTMLHNGKDRLLPHCPPTNGNYHDKWCEIQDNASGINNYWIQTWTDIQSYRDKVLNLGAVPDGMCISAHSFHLQFFVDAWTAKYFSGETSCLHSRPKHCSSLEPFLCAIWRIDQYHGPIYNFTEKSWTTPQKMSEYTAVKYQSDCRENSRETIWR